MQYLPNGIVKLNFTGDKTGNLTMHKYFAATGCPGQYLEGKFPYIADEVNKILSGNKKDRYFFTCPKQKKVNLDPFKHQIYASIFSVISALIVLYVVIENWYQNPNINSIENPIV